MFNFLKLKKDFIVSYQYESEIASLDENGCKTVLMSQLVKKQMVVEAKTKKEASDYISNMYKYVEPISGFKILNVEKKLS